MKFNIIYLSKVNSTNSYALQQIENNALNHGDVIFTPNQESGKGQADNTWESEPGSNLQASIILTPKMIDAAEQFVLTQLISLAIIDLIKSYLPSKKLKQELKIKWPNDIYVGDKKIAGILFQNFIKGNKIEYSIVGIGINVNQTNFFSSAPNPISIIHKTNKLTDIDILLKQLLNNIGSNYEKLSIKGYFAELKTKYINNMYRFNIWANYSDIEGDFRGKIIDFDEYGRLIVLQESGAEKLYMFKEIKFI
jgi:BirA family biotin operon repressor/biotin-[acetyl-CoA-carboxylase] ligase